MTYVVRVWASDGAPEEEIVLEATGSRVPPVGERIFMHVRGVHRIGEVIRHNA